MKKNYVVYQHVTPDGLYYFGQTQNVERRWRNNGAEYKRTALQPYIEKFGWDNIQHIVLFREQTRENALWIEDFLIETAREDGVCINKQRSGLVSKNKDYKQNYYREYDQKRSEKRRGYKREYREKNRDKINEQSRQYYEQNRDEILEQKKQYYEQNREKINEQRKQRYQKNRDEINERRRQRYKRKKLEKQLKEVETTLF